MDDRFQTAAFIGDLQALVKRYRHEFAIPYVNVIGALEIYTHDLKCEAFQAAREFGEDEDD